MSRRSESREWLEDAIVVDEIGIESGNYGIYRLRSLYQPIFEKRGQSLYAIGVEGWAAPFLAGDDVPQEMFLTGVAEGDVSLIRQIRLALPVRNLANIDRENTKLVMDIAAHGDDADEVIQRIRFVAEEVENADLQPELVVCMLAEPVAAEPSPFAELVDEIRRTGMQGAIGDFGMGRWSDEQIDLLAPEIARIDGEWFRQVCRDAITVRLFESVVVRLHERGVKVLVCGLENEQQFSVAVEAGADLFQGRHLSATANVGMLDMQSLSVREKQAISAKVHPLRTTHKRR